MEPKDMRSNSTTDEWRELWRSVPRDEFAGAKFLVQIYLAGFVDAGKVFHADTTQAERILEIKVT